MHNTFKSLHRCFQHWKHTGVLHVINTLLLVSYLFSLNTDCTSVEKYLNFVMFAVDCNFTAEKC